jgi:hypothetical protein
LEGGASRKIRVVQGMIRSEKIVQKNNGSDATTPRATTKMGLFYREEIEYELKILNGGYLNGFSY